MELQLSRPQLCSNGKRVFAKLRYIWTSGPPIADTVASVVILVALSLVHVFAGAPDTKPHPGFDGIWKSAFGFS